MQVAMGGPQSNRDPLRVGSKYDAGMTDPKNSLLSLDDLTLSATDGTALKQQMKTNPN
jgi:hypothetical protein